MGLPTLSSAAMAFKIAAVLHAKEIDVSAVFDSIEVKSFILLDI